MGILRSQKFDFPDSGLIVIYGQNEVGKSTSADMITFLLAQTGLDKETKRFGEIGEFMEGEIEGKINNKFFKVKRTFTLGKKHSPEDSKDIIKLGDTAIDHHEWMKELRIDQMGFERIYRLRGETLFSEEEQANEIIEKLASGIDNFDPKASIESLETLKKQALSNSSGTNKKHFIDLKHWCSNYMAKYKIPRVFEIREKLPKNKMGKIMWRDLE